jgi:hypothetical protein
MSSKGKKGIYVIFSNNLFKSSIGSGDRSSNNICSIQKEVKQSKFEAFIKERFDKFISNRMYIYFEEEEKTPTVCFAVFGY